MKRFKNLIFAGTFDHLHIGHKYMFKKAFELAERVSVGITSDEMVKKKGFGESIEKIEDRRLNIERYLQENNLFERAQIFILHDIYGPSVKDYPFDAILVAEATKKNALKINRVRKLKGLKDLEIIVAPFVKGDDGKIVTSERIRAGEIDRDGKQYKISNIKDQKYLKLPEEMREELRKPLGRVIGGLVDQLSETAKKVVGAILESPVKPPMVISVGDVVTYSLLGISYEPDIMIVDFRSRRMSLETISNIKNQIAKIQIKYQKDKKEVNNEPGTINIDATRIIRKSTKNVIGNKNKQLIVAKGEEDLLALPAILFAPLGSAVVYGQWNLGVVVVEVTEEKKKQVKEILGKFTYRFL